MIVNVWFVIVGFLLVLMALIGAGLKRLPLTTSLLYLGVGVLLGPLAIGLIRFDPLDHSEALERLTEIAVIVSLFTAGLKLRTPFTDKRWLPPVRLATLTMVVSIGLVTALGVYLLRLPLGAALLLGAVLAPTDPVLASDVQVEHATDRSSLRFALTGEAGLNDGTAFPFVMLGLGLLGHHDLGEVGWRWLTVDLLWAVVAGLGVGWALGQGVGRLTVRLRRKREEEVGYEDLLSLGLIALAYGTALLLHSYGFLAVFAAGLAVRHVEMRKTGEHKEPTQVLQEATSELSEAGPE
ncbi:sodium:proton antiporter, partial [bacterium]